MSLALNHSPTYLSRQDLSANLGVTESTRLAVERAPVIFLSPAFAWVLGMRTQVLGFAQQTPLTEQSSLLKYCYRDDGTIKSTVLIISKCV